MAALDAERYLATKEFAAKVNAEAAS